MTVTKASIGGAINDYMMPYSKHVITERAIADLRDGLKPSQRLGLWSMYEAKLYPDKKRMKSVGVSGLMLKYHPHSDQSAYETLARMAQNDSFLHPYVDPKGNMGQRTSTEVTQSSSRYTEMRLSEIAMDMFANIDKDAVTMVNNFDDSLKQPEVLPSPFPSILTMGSMGIAVGFASNIPSFNLREVCDYTIKRIKGEETDMLTPDFATGAQIIYNKEEVEKINKTGDGKLSIRGTWRMEDEIIIIDSIPYTTTREAIINKAIDLVNEGKLKEITNIRDATDLEGMKIEIEVRKNTNVDNLMLKMFKFTPLESNFSSNMNVIYNDKPVKLGVSDIVDNWIEFRIQVIRNIAKNQLDKNEFDLNILEGLAKVLLDIDKAIEIVKASETDKELIDKLKSAFGLNDIQADKISNYKLKNLKKSYINERLKEIDNIKRANEILNLIIHDDKYTNESIISGLKRVSDKYGRERVSKIVDGIVTYEDKVNPIDDYNVRIFASRGSYIKKIPLTSLRGDFKNKVKDGDEIIREFDTTNNSDILVFTSLQNVYKIKTYELEDHKTSILGEYLPAYLGLKDEEIVYITATKDYSGNLFIGFEDGKVAKIDLKAYWTKQNRSMLKKAYADKKTVFFNDGSDFDLLALSSIGKVVVLNTEYINAKSSKGTQGVSFMKPKDGSHVASYYNASELDLINLDYYRISNAGVGKNVRKEDKNIIVERGQK